MARSTIARAETRINAPIDIVWNIATRTNPTWFYAKFGPLPAVVDVRGHVGEWSGAGSTRTLLLSDGNSATETITDDVYSEFFAYSLTNFTGFVAHLVSASRAEWDFWENEDGTTGTRWTHQFEARMWAKPIVDVLVRVLWTRYLAHTSAIIAHEAERQQPAALLRAA
jgi:hypothetical protein